MCEGGSDLCSLCGLPIDTHFFDDDCPKPKGEAKGEVTSLLSLLLLGYLALVI